MNSELHSSLRRVPVNHQGSLNLAGSFLIRVFDVTNGPIYSLKVISGFPFKYSLANGRQKKERETEMHSFGNRANVLLTFSITIFALICGMASFSDNFNKLSPTAQIQVLNVNWFQKKPDGDDEVSLTLNISANLESLFTWNTKQVFVFLTAEYDTPKNSLNQVSLWDGIIPSKEHSKFWIHTTNKYRFVDQGSNLRGKDFNLTLHWHVMPKTGKMFADNLVMSGFRLPDSYR